MVEFPKQVKVSAEKTYQEWREVEVLTEEERKGKLRRAVRVTAKYLPDLRKEVRSGELVWYSDSSKVVGGLGEHPGALQHFIAGLPLCQMTHYAERASISGTGIQDLEVSVVGRYVGMSGHGFEEIVYEVKVTSLEPADKVRELASAAANDCYVTNTLKRACKVTGKIFLNGESLMLIP